MTDPTVSDVIDSLTAAGLSCPECGEPLVGARIAIVGDHPHGDLGLVCRTCGQAYMVAEVPE